MSIFVQQKVNNKWCLYCFLIKGADKPGHYGPAANSWAWAKNLIKHKPLEFRIINEDETKNKM